MNNISFQILYGFHVINTGSLMFVDLAIHVHRAPFYVCNIGGESCFIVFKTVIVAYCVGEIKSAAHFTNLVVTYWKYL